MKIGDIDLEMLYKWGVSVAGQIKSYALGGGKKGTNWLPIFSGS
jgi:hypothetical protein